MTYNQMWDLNTAEKIPGMTWWWWWWIFFIHNDDAPKRPLQLMILWSTKNCETIKVNHHWWKPSGSISQLPNKLEFNGMTAIWFYDGKKMIEPLALEPSDFTVNWKGDAGRLKPHTDNTYIFKGDPKKYNVRITKGDYDFDLEMTPWNDFMGEHRYNSNKYGKKFSYNILKIYGTRLAGSMTLPERGKKKIKGTAYFQKVMVNAPAVPWYWGVLHIEDGSYIDYFKPHVGFPMFRRTDRPRSLWDFGELALNRNIQYYIKSRDKRIMFRKMSVIKSFTRENLPVFRVSGRTPKSTIDFTLRAYSRAYWRFEQPWWGRFNSILYYNEYPVIMENFLYRDSKGKITLDDLGSVVGNSEHSWGTLMW